MEFGKENNSNVINKATVLEFSPVKSMSTKEKPLTGTNTGNDIISTSKASLLCTKFQNPAWIEFGNVIVGSINSQRFELINPSETKSVHICKAQDPKNISISFGPQNESKVVIPPRQKVTGAVIWSPNDDVAIRETVVLKMDRKAPLQLIIHGVAGLGNVKDSSSVKCAPGNSFKAEKLTIGKRKSISSFNGAADSIKNHARASLSLAKKEKIRGTIKILDNNWAEKQTESFTEWMNYTFLQSESDQSEELEESQALSNNELYSPALCQLLQKRADAKHRQQAMLLYKAEEVSFAIQLLNFEVDEDRLIVREDRDVFADLGLHEVLFGLLFSYELSWLKLALETVFNTPITLQGKTKEGTLVEQRLSRSSVKWKQLLKNFLTQHLLSNDQILSQFPKQKLLYAVQEKKMKVLLRKHFAKSFLAIIKFLDAARLRQLLPLSTLFRKDSTVKSSRDVVCEFCRSFLHGEGDIIRHLSLIHYHVQFEQSYVDEFDYKVSNLALDLRDGVRLARLVETLKKSYELSPQLRVPAVSRLQKLHNVSIVLKTLYSNSEKAPDAKHIIDGHRDITLLLLWKIMYSFELRMMINEQKVYEEVQAIEQNGWRRSLYNEDDAVGLAVQVPIKCKDGSLRLPTSIKHDPEASADSIDTESNAAFCAIIRWCQAIAWHYEVPVYNLTSCLADGRVLCLLVHYYHPSILPVKHIRKTTANFLDNSLSKTSLDEFMDKSSLTKSELQQGLSGEQRNFITLKRACACIGGIPMILPNIDSRNIPEEKTMVVFLGYLFGRLIESSAQVRASIRIQRAFRNSLQFLRKNSKMRMTETTIIAEASCRMRSNSATMSMPVKILLSADKAAAMIQKWFVSQRTRSILKKRIADKAIAVAAKSQERLVTEKTEVELVSQTVGDEDTMSLVDQLKEQVQKELEARLEQERLLLQSMESKREEEARIHEEFLIQQALEKQRIEQENCEREIREQEAKVVAQMKYEAEEALEKAKQRVLELENTLLLDRQSSAVIERRKLELEQALAEEVARRQEFMDLIEKEEDHLREEHQARLLSEEEVKNERKARALAEERLQEEAVARQQAEERLRQIEEELLLEKLQVQKAFEEKQRLKALQRASALAIQSRWRCKRAQLHFAKRIRYVIVIQSLFRRSVAQKRANCAILAILLLQAYWRRKLCFKEIALQDRSARVLQQWIKAKACRRHYLMLKSSIRKLMSTWLMHKHVKHLIKLKIVALHCQRLVRGFCDRRKAQKRLTSILKIQKNARFFLSTLMLQKQNKSASVIQKSWRVFLNLKIKQSRMQGNLVKQFVMNRSSKRIVSIFRNNLVWKLRNYAVLSITRWYISKRILLRAKKLCKGFRRLAAFYRARKVRSVSSKKVREMVLRIKQAEANAVVNPEMKLGRLTTSALHTLQHGKMISQLLKACQVLELSTQVSIRCCEAFARAAASNILFSLLRSCNRSTPHQELLRIALVVLLNVARKDHLAAIVAESDDAIDGLIDLMQMFRDKRSIFSLACELLCRLVKANELTKDQCNSPACKKRLDGLKDIIERKNRLEQRVRKATGASNKLPIGREAHNDGSQLYKVSTYESIEQASFMEHLMKLLAY